VPLSDLVQAESSSRSTSVTLSCLERGWGGCLEAGLAGQLSVPHTFQLPLAPS